MKRKRALSRPPTCHRSLFDGAQVRGFIAELKEIARAARLNLKASATPPIRLDASLADPSRRRNGCLLNSPRPAMPGRALVSAPRRTSACSAWR